MTVDLRGLSVALATPFDPRGEVDLDAFRRLCRHVEGGGADVLVALGSTGEANTVDDRERDDIIAACVDEARRATVVVGCGHASTRQSCAWAARAEALGARGALVVTPPYVKPTRAGLLAHYRAIAEAAPALALIAYKVPSRTGQNLTPDVLAELWSIPSVFAVKESSGDLMQIGRIAAELPSGKLLLAGDDGLALPSIACGAQGLVSVAGNVAPRAVAELVAAARPGEIARARELAARLRPLMTALFVESNPIPLKAALVELGIAGDTLRLPLTTPEPATRRRIAQAIAALREEVHA